MACEKITAFQFYFMDNFNDYISGRSIDEAYNKAEDEWKAMIEYNKDIVFYYIQKEMEIEHNRIKKMLFEVNL
jgi:hypothetical protein